MTDKVVIFFSKLYVLLTLFFNITLLLSVGRTAYAVNIQQYSRSNSLTFEMLEDARLENSHVFSDFNSIITLGVSYVDQPLVVKSADNSEQVAEVIPNMTNLHFGGGYHLLDWLQLGTSVNFSFFENNQGESFNDFGDIELRLKTRLLHKKKHALSIMPLYSFGLNGGDTEVVDSTGFRFGRDTVLSDGGNGSGLRLIYETVFRKLQIVTNLGYVVSPDAIFIDDSGVTQIDMRQRLLTGIGVYWPAFDRMGFNFEFLKTWSNPFFNNNLNPAEYHIGASGALSRRIHAFGGVNFGNLFSSADGNDFRLIAGLKITPTIDRKKVYERQGVRPAKELRVIKESEGMIFCSEAPVFGKSNRVNVLFPNDVHTLNQKQKSVVEKIANILNKRDKDVQSINLIGHASPVYRADYNQKLSEKRVTAVREELKSRLNSSEKLTPPLALGDTQPKIKQPLKKLDQKYNRRVELIVELKECRGN